MIYWILKDAINSIFYKCGGPRMSLASDPQVDNSRPDRISTEAL